MNNWKVVRLGDVCSVVSGTTPKSNVSEYWNGELNWVTPAELNDETTVVYETQRKITPAAVRASSLKSFPAGTVLLSSRAPIGKVAIAGTEMYCNQGFKNLVCSERIHNGFLFRYLKGKTEYLNSLGRGATFKEISKTIVEDIQIPLPPISEQHRMSSLLDKVNGLMTLRKQQLEQLDLMVKSRFVEMFGDPLRNPKGWPVRKLKEITSAIQSGNTPKGGKQVYVDSGTMFFRSQNVWRNRIELDDIAYIDEKTHRKMSQTSLKHKDILITKTGRFNTENSSLGRAALFLGEDGSANINGHVYLVRLREGITHEFVLYILVTDEYRDYIRKVCVGGIDKRQINKEHLEEFPIITPPLSLQTRFADFVRQVDKSKFEVQEGLKKLEQQYNALMQQYFG